LKEAYLPLIDNVIVRIVEGGEELYDDVTEEQQVDSRIEHGHAYVHTIVVDESHTPRGRDAGDEDDPIIFNLKDSYPVVTKSQTLLYGSSGYMIHFLRSWLLTFLVSSFASRSMSGIYSSTSL
jgi:hypothetical protein